MQTTIGIDIDAPAALVFSIARDVTRWERLLPHYSRSRLDRRHPDGSVTCLFVARRPLIGMLGLGLPVAWRSQVSSDPVTRRIRFRHIGALTHGMQVTWHVQDRAGGARVDIEHLFDRGPAQLLPRFVDRFFTQAIAGRTLATFKALAEALHADELRS